MHRRTVLTSLTSLVALPAVLPVISSAARQSSPQASQPSPRPSSRQPRKLVPPPQGDINVAVLLSEGATIIDFCGPWEVFQDVALDGSHSSSNHRMPFRLYTVAETRDPIRATGGMRIIPDHTLDDAPAPRVVVIPAQGGRSARMLDWIRKTHETADITLSVCTGAFLLASTGLLKGRAATTHHDFYDRFASKFPDVELRRGLRFVEEDALMTAGGLSSGIDAALRIVDRYYGRDVAQQTATYMEYQGTGWMT